MPSTRKVALTGGSGQTQQPHALEKEAQGGPQNRSKVLRAPNFTDKKPGLRFEGARVQPHGFENLPGPAVSFLALNVNFSFPSFFLGGWCCCYAGSSVGVGWEGARLFVVVPRVGLTC